MPSHAPVRTAGQLLLALGQQVVQARNTVLRLPSPLRLSAQRRPQGSHLGYRVSALHPRAAWGRRATGSLRYQACKVLRHSNGRHGRDRVRAGVAPRFAQHIVQLVGPVPKSMAAGPARCATRRESAWPLAVCPRRANEHVRHKAIETVRDDHGCLRAPQRRVVACGGYECEGPLRVSVTAPRALRKSAAPERCRTR